ncbi:ankyrin repeat domain-containing protein SOWAHC-like [Solea senegalensis]|uniref:Ankyrin repeat domain-containing protein SOWAHC-like n=1 Tax=Solea senegalensis TaxID=28829 RepID=A0AAV6QDW1_SOLSE|nr:ankyrin repeat domain-containing protein SOWAHC-like [Solea senegalensis]KAG7486682.1 ankyrin repeat domain-containing protein SOWAHC-like [Solea senegalensis]
MGNTNSFWSERRSSTRSSRRSSRRSSKRESMKSNTEQVGNTPSIPEISVTEASPLPSQGSVFILPEPVQTCRTRQADTAVDGLSPTDIQVQSEPLPLDLKETEQNPEVRRSMVLRRSLHLSNKSDSDSVSLVSFNPDEDRMLVTLDPLEHEWMMCASDGEWASLHHLLTKEPSIVLRKDFVTGFTCLHWAAKHGKPELIARIINFAKQHNIPISVDVRSNIGYTPLHIATMHNHIEVVKVLVGAYNADVEVRDYSGRKACQYLAGNASVDIQDIIGADEQINLEHEENRDSGCRRFSKVLQFNLKPLRLLNPSYCDSVDGDTRTREKPVRRKSTLSMMKPNLQKLRYRASEIIHSTTFHDTEEPEGSLDGSRLKSHFLV